jgi:DegV family protein with EDD domain
LSLKIITDSACDLPQEIVEEYDIKVLSFPVYIEGKEFLDGETIEPREVYDAIRADLVPTTAQVPLSSFIAAFRKYASEGRACLYLAFSSKMSGTCATAHLAADQVRSEYPSAQIAIVDTRSGSLGQGLIVLEAAQMAREGKGTEEIVKRAEELSENGVEHVFSVDDLNYLHRGGRVSYASAFIGSLLSVKPILHVKDGLIIPFQKVRGTRKALERIVELVKERASGDPDQLIAITHADDPGKAQQLQDLLREKLGYRNFLVNVVGCVLGCHIGLGGVAAFFVGKEQVAAAN